MRALEMIRRFLNRVEVLIIVQNTVYFPCNMSVKSNFTFDLIFVINEDSEKNWFPFFLCQKSKTAAK